MPTLILAWNPDVCTSMWHSAAPSLSSARLPGALRKMNESYVGCSESSICGTIYVRNQVDDRHQVVVSRHRLYRLASL